MQGASRVEGMVSVFITAGRIYRLNNARGTDSGPPWRKEINVVVMFAPAGNYCFFQEGKKRHKNQRLQHRPCVRMEDARVPWWRCGGVGG